MLTSQQASVEGCARYDLNMKAHSPVYFEFYCVTALAELTDLEATHESISVDIEKSDKQVIAASLLRRSFI